MTTERKITPRPQQIKLAQALIDNMKKKEPDGIGAVLVSVGYAKSTGKAEAARTIEAEGLQQALIDKGFSTENAKNVVASILKRGKDENKLRAADMVFKVNGDYAPEKRINLNVEMPMKELSDEELAKMAYNQADTVSAEAPK